MQAGNQAGGHQPTRATAATSVETRTQAHTGLMCSHTAHSRVAKSQLCPGPRSVAAGSRVHPESPLSRPTADGLKIPFTNWEESQHQVMDPSEMETVLETSVMPGKTVWPSGASSAAHCRAVPPTHRQT